MVKDGKDRKTAAQWPLTRAKGERPGLGEGVRGTREMAMERLFAMVDKRTLDIFHCQHSVGPTPLLSTTRYESKNNIGSDAKFVRDSSLYRGQRTDSQQQFFTFRRKRNFVDYLPGVGRGKERYRGWRKFALWRFVNFRLYEARFQKSGVRSKVILDR